MWSLSDYAPFLGLVEAREMHGNGTGTMVYYFGNLLVGHSECIQADNLCAFPLFEARRWFPGIGHVADPSPRPISAILDFNGF